MNHVSRQTMLASILSLTFTFPMPSKPTFRIHIASIPSSTQENASPVPPTITFALPASGSAAEDLLRRAPAPKPQAAYNVIKSQLLTWNLNTPNPGVEYDKSITSFASGFPSDSMNLDNEIEREEDVYSNAVDGDRWMAIEPPGPFPP